MKKGKLYLIPTFLADTNDESNFPAINLEITSTLNHFIVENVRTARRFLRKTGYTHDFEQVVFLEMNKHTDPSRFTVYLEPAKQGHDIGLLSEAGVPCVADPGSAIVTLAHENDIQVIPLTGPSSIFLALMASGFNGQHFLFHGYLPIDRKEREHKIREIERQAQTSRQTQIFIETPYRNNQLLETILKVCREDTLLCIGSMMTHQTLEFIKTKPIGNWKAKLPDLNKKPAVFLIY